MNIINEIMKLNRRCNAAKVFPGEGVNVEHRPDGCVVSIDTDETKDDSPAPLAFEATIEGDTVSVERGDIMFDGEGWRSFSGGTITASAGTLLITIYKDMSNPVLSISNIITYPLYTDTTYKVLLADIAQESNGTFSIRRKHHVGDILLQKPPSWISGYNASATQCLIHSIGGGWSWSNMPS